MSNENQDLDTSVKAIRAAGSDSIEVTGRELERIHKDKLWKGKRVPDLEELLVKRVNEELNLEYWEVFTRLDSCFEAIAGRCDERLERSRSPA